MEERPPNLDRFLFKVTLILSPRICGIFIKEKSGLLILLGLASHYACNQSEGELYAALYATRRRLSPIPLSIGAHTYRVKVVEIKRGELYEGSNLRDDNNNLYSMANRVKLMIDRLIDLCCSTGEKRDATIHKQTKQNKKQCSWSYNQNETNPCNLTSLVYILVLQTKPKIKIHTLFLKKAEKKEILSSRAVQVHVFRATLQRFLRHAVLSRLAVRCTRTCRTQFLP